MHTTDATPTEADTEECIGTDTKMRKNKKVRVEEKWPKGLYCALFITHRLFLDFGSLLHPLAGRRTGGRAGVGTGQGRRIREHKNNRREGEEEEEIKKVNKRKEDSKSPKPNGGCAVAAFSRGGGGGGRMTDKDVKCVCVCKGSVRTAVLVVRYKPKQQLRG